MQLGTSFSHRQLKELDCAVLPALNQAIDLNFDYLRLCSYWSEIEKEPGVYDFSELETFLALCEQRQQKIVLTLGMKAPRYPEFYFPSWLAAARPQDSSTQAACLAFLAATLSLAKQFSCISHFQLENEALNPAGPDKEVLPLDFLKKELSLLKQLAPKQPVIFSVWGNQLSKSSALQKLAPLADIIALDLYNQQFIGKFLGKSIYKGPSDSDQKIARLLTQSAKEAWILELQAEPWEASQEDYLAANPASISPAKIKEFYQRARKLPVRAIFFWGFEYAYYQAQKLNNCLYLETLADCIIENQ